MLYSVVRGAAGNRPDGVPLEEKIDVGFALYPWAIGTKANNMDVAPQSAHVVGGDYLWKDSEYFFAELSGGIPRVVRVVIADGVATVDDLTLSKSILGPADEGFIPRLQGAELSGSKVTLALQTNEVHTVVASSPDFVLLGSIDLNSQPK